MKKCLLGLFSIALVACGGAEQGQGSNSSSTEAAKPVEYIKVTANELLKAYKENEVSANQKYQGKPLEVSGKIDSIEAGLADKPYVVLKAGGEFEFVQPQAHFNEDEINKVANLKKGQAITLLCEGDGEVAGGPMLSDCRIK